MKALLIASVIVLTTNIAHAQTQKPLEQLQKEDQLRHAMDVINAFDASIKTATAERGRACIRAFGEERFCKCLNDNLPIAWTFENYVAITAHSKDDNGYARLTPEHQRAYDRVFVVRDACVQAQSKAK